jgi:hypothetical protein
MKTDPCSFWYSFPIGYTTRNLLRIMAFSLALFLFSIPLGIFFWLIFHGIFWGLLGLAPYWKPAYLLTATIAGAEKTDREFKPMQIHWVVFPFKCLSIGARFTTAAIGIWLVFRIGFLQQNLIYLLFIK